MLAATKNRLTVEVEQMEMIRKIRCKRMACNEKGMSLIEIMIAVVILGILAAIALPSYTAYVIEGHRSQALADMAKIQLKLEENYNAGYSATGIISGGVCIICDSDTDRYAMSLTTTSTGYTITATPQSTKGQNSDKCDGTSYTSLTLTQPGEGTPSACWK